MPKHNVASRKQKKGTRRIQVRNPAGLFVNYFKERDWYRKNSATLAAPKDGMFAGDTIQIEYVRGKSALYITSDGEAHVILYEECPLPKQTLEWLRLSQNKKPKRAKRYAPKNNAMRAAMQEASRHE